MSGLGPVDPVGGFWSPDSTSVQLVSTTTPTGVVEGQQWYDPDDDRVYWYNGTNWILGVNAGDWVAYTSSTTGFSLGSGSSQDCAYTRMGKTVWYRIKITIGTGGSVTSAILVSIPVLPASWYTVNTPLGDAVGLDQGVAVYHGRAIATANTTANREVHPTNQASPAVGYNSTVPFTWAQTDQLFIFGTYEAATAV